MAETGESFGEVLSRHAHTKPDQPAIIYPDQSISWSEFEDAVAQRAAALWAEGVKPDDMVAIALPNGPEHHAWSFATWSLGATPCIMPEKLPGHELGQLLDLARPQVLVGASGEPPAGVRRLEPTTATSPSATRPITSLAARYWKAVSSGGSTGRPKLIVDHGEARFNRHIIGLLETLGLPADGVILNPGPLYHNGPFMFSNLALLAGNTVVGMVRFDAEECLRLIEDYGVQWVCLVPTMMHRIWNLPDEVRARYDLSSLQRVWHMAASCPAWLKKAWIEWLGPDRIVELYGGTEAPGSIITGREWLAKPGSVGKAETGGIIIRREDGCACTPGEVGEIFLSPSAMDRFHYLGANAKRSNEGELSLGDLGYVDEDGYLFLADRRTDLILRGGANIYPAEVEDVLKEHAAIAEAIVIGLPDPEYGHRVHAILELAPDVTPSLPDIDRFVRARLASYKRPETYEIVRDQLRNDAGKARRSMIRDVRLTWLEQGRAFQARV
jgi:bile acid-coenzyme A ligase